MVAAHRSGLTWPEINERLSSPYANWRTLYQCVRQSPYGTHPKRLTK